MPLLLLQQLLLLSLLLLSLALQLAPPANMPTHTSMPGRSLTVPSLPRQCHAVAPASHIGQWNIHGRFQAQEAAMTSRMLARLPRADNRRQLFVYGPHALYGFIMRLTRRSLPTAYAPAGRTLAPTDAFAPAATPRPRPCRR